jgi:hypothetical protein
MQNLMFSWMIFYYYGVTFSAKTVYLREAGRTGSLNELKIQVEKCLFLDNQKGKNGAAS